MAGFTPISFAPKSLIAGIAVSPDGNTLYASIQGSGSVQTYNAHTGAIINAAFAALPTYKNLNGATVDPATGDIYWATTNGNGGVTKITPAGVVNETWGTPPASAAYPVGLTVYSGKLYLGTASSGANAIVSYPLPGGGLPTQVVSGFRGDWPSFDSGGNLYAFKSNAPAYWQKWDIAGNTHANFGNIQFEGYGQESQYDATSGLLYVTGALTGHTSAGVWSIDPTAATPTYTQVVTFTGGYTYAASFALVPAVPEPSTLALLGMGLAGLICYAWRKRK